MNIGILGGGIGGLSSAIALKQLGFDVSVYERHSKPSGIGAGVVCWPNASFVLDQLGVIDKVASVAGALVSMDRFTSLGEPIGSLDIAELNRLMSYPSYSIIRKDLMGILLQRAAELGINIYYDHEVVDIFDDGHQLGVSFKNTKSIRPDIVVGADGRMNSVCRRYVFGNGTPIYQGFINWIGVVEHDSINFSKLSVLDYWGVGDRFGIVPVARNKAYWAGATLSERVDRVDASKYRAELNSVFRGWPEIVQKVIATTPQAMMNKIYVHDHEPINSWHKANLVLLGDAAHSPLPTSGQGACQALEDAWHLASSLKRCDGDIECAFLDYCEVRQSKTAGITLGARQLASSIFNRDVDYCQRRNAASAEADYHKVVASMAKAWSRGLPISA